MKIKIQIGATLLAVIALFAFLWTLKIGYDVRYDSFLYSGWEAHTRPILDVLFFLLAVGSVFSFRIWKKILSNRVLVWFSLISYNWYLWHQCVARVLMEKRIPTPLTSDPHQDAVWCFKFFWLSLAAGLAITSVMTYIIERPILNWGHRFLKGRPQSKA